MIISHKHKFIFIKTHKTAGTSMEIALSSICGPDDIITPISGKDQKIRESFNFRGPQNYHYKKSNYSVKDWLKYLLKREQAGYYNHISAAEIKTKVSEDIWSNYYKFAFERNPYDKLISWFYWFGRDFDSMDKFIEEGEAIKVKGRELYCIHNEIALDKIYLYENIPEALVDISQILKLDRPLNLPRKKSKSHTRKDNRPYNQVLTKSQKDWVKTTYAWELAQFGY